MQDHLIGLPIQQVTMHLMLNLLVTTTIHIYLLVTTPTGPM